MTAAHQPERKVTMTNIDRATEIILGRTAPAAAPDLAQTVIEHGKRIEELEAQNKALRNTDTSEWGY